MDPGGNHICDLLSQLHPVQERAREAGSCKLFLEAIQNRTTSSGGFNEDLCYPLLRTDLEPHRVVVRVVDSIQFLKLRTCEHNDLGVRNNAGSAAERVLVRRPRHANAPLERAACGGGTRVSGGKRQLQGVLRWGSPGHDTHRGHSRRLGSESSNGVERVLVL